MQMQKKCSEVPLCRCRSRGRTSTCGDSAVSGAQERQKREKPPHERRDEWQKLQFPRRKCFPDSRLSTQQLRRPRKQQRRSGILLEKEQKQLI